MRILGIDHIGIASGELGRHIEIFGGKLGLEVVNFQAVRDARAAGLTIVDETPRPGARGSKIAFLHPRSTGGVLIHLVERPDQETR